MGPQVVRDSERPELRDALTGLSDEVWPEYNQHGATLSHYWDQLYEIFPDWQFVLYDPGDETVLAEGHTIPVAWDGTDAGLGPGIDATVTAAFELQAASGRPTAVSALAAAIPPRHQRRGLAKVMLQAMAGLAHDAGLAHLIAPVRPTLKDRYPTIPIERYARWMRPDGTPFDPSVAGAHPSPAANADRLGGERVMFQHRSCSRWAAGTIAALGLMVSWPASRYAPSLHLGSMGQEGSYRAGDEWTQDSQAGLEVGENAAVRSHELFQLAAVFGLIQDDRWLVGFLEREQLTAQALRPGLQGRAGGPVGHGDQRRAGPRR